SKSFITSGERLYNPRFNKDGSKIIAVNFDKDNNWALQELDLEGRPLRTLKKDGHKFLEATYLNDNEVIALVTKEFGRKSIAKVNINTGNLETLVPLTWNNIYWLQTDYKNSVLFEAQYQGKVEVFKLNTSTKALTKCTTSRIAAYAPNFAGSEIT